MKPNDLKILHCRPFGWYICTGGDYFTTMYYCGGMKFFEQGPVYFREEEDAKKALKGIKETYTAMHPPSRSAYFMGMDNA